jgi:Histidine kinase/Y_Y_Y domain/Two component regulator propeller
MAFVGGLPYGCNYPWITSINEDATSGKLLVTYWGAGFNWFDPKSGKFSKPKLAFTPEGPCWKFLQKSIIESPKEIYLFEWGEPIILYNSVTGTFNYVSKITKAEKHLSLGLTYTAYKDQSGGIWVGFDQEKGLIHYKKDGGDSLIWRNASGERTLEQSVQTHQYLVANPQDPSGLKSGTITTIFEDSKSRMWVGTPAGLHLLLDNDKVFFKRYDKQHGFQDASINGILEDKENKLWVSTNNGLAVFNPISEKVERIYTHHDGLPGAQFSVNASCKTKNGIMVFGGMRGLTVFNPKELGKNTKVPFSAIEKVIGDGKVIPIDYDKNEVRIPAKVQDLKIECAALDYVDPKSNHFQFQLHGKDKDRSQPSEISFVQYSGLKHGAYNFEVYTCNNDSEGFTEASKANLRIIVEPRWHQTPLAFLLFTLLAIGVIWYNRNRYLSQKQEEQRKINLKIKVLQVQLHQAQMNPHFTFNVLTAIKSLIVNKQPEQAAAYLDKFAILIRRYLEISVKNGQINQSVVNSEIPLSQEIELIDMYVDFELLKYENKFTYHHAKPSFVVENVSVPPMLIQPFVENAIKWGLLSLPGGENGNLWIRYTLDENDEVLSVVVEDDGIGREAAKKIKESSIKHFDSLGTALTEERRKILNQLGYDISITTEDRNGGGTVVTITIA